MHRALPLLVLALWFAAALAPAACAAGTPAGTARPRTTAGAAPKRSVASHAVTARKAVRDSARTLEPIHIEGELDVPEVLFITARDQRRIVEFQHRRYLKTSAELLRDAPPTRLVVARGAAPAAAPPPATTPSATGDPR